MNVCVMGAGAFGTALAISLAQSGAPVTLWGRSETAMQAMAQARENPDYLPGIKFPASLHPVTEVPRAAEVLLLAVPMQQLRGVVDRHLTQSKASMVACCKGLSLETWDGPTAALPGTPAVLTGPSFASDIARGLPTALTLACADMDHAEWLQRQLTTPNLRLYRTTDVIGAELGGALKNVIAIGCGAVMGAGLGVSARAALMTRGFAEMMRFAEAQGATRDTLAGLSGLGDLTLTCTSDLSRNYQLGLALGSESAFDPNTTTEGAATARAVVRRAIRDGIDMPICTTIAALVDGEMNIKQAAGALLSRPMKEE